MFAKTGLLSLVIHDFYAELRAFVFNSNDDSVHTNTTYCIVVTFDWNSYEMSAGSRGFQCQHPPVLKTTLSPRPHGSAPGSTVSFFCNFCEWHLLVQLTRTFAKKLRDVKLAPLSVQAHFGMSVCACVSMCVLPLDWRYS